ncbi:putative PA14 domain protein [Rosellinia necatrix]|uniref:Putative PA14 domain protein n=1 Tax=Rosellinia necatrix TaxID=77044 RepID=A0A1W2TSK6_ROSNE|nr:putative PA14 domain protein [Rosellinia necatrix]
MTTQLQEHPENWLRPFLGTQFPNYAGSLDTLISQIGQRSDLPAEVIKGLAKTAGGNPDLLRHILQDHQVSSLQLVAQRICPLGLTNLSVNPASAFPKDDLVAFRSRLLAVEPTALLHGILDSDAFPADATTRADCQTVLKMMQTAGLDMSKDSVRGVLHDPEYMKTIPEQRHQQLADMIARLQRLQAVVFDPDDIVGLLEASYYSAVSIARSSEESFASAVAPHGIDQAAATRIHRQAGLVSRRNEQVWIQALRAKNEISLQSTENKADDGPVNLSTLFKDLIQSTDCSDCSSITSPAAYFVDFLHCLDKWPKDKEDKDKSLLGRLFDRRPDLGNLHLSCANTLVPLPYIDLVNEALESVVAHSQAIVTDVYDMDDSYDTDEVTEPRHVTYEVYQKTIQPQLFPLGTFPYNLAVDSIRAYFRAFGTTRYESMQKLQSPYRLAAVPLSESDQKLASEVLERFATAEYLDLQEEDYIAVTGEAVQTSQFLGISNKADYQRAIGLQPVNAYWGYKSTADMTSMNEGSKTGLVFIKDQFLPRSELSFDQLLELLRSPFLQGEIVIEMYNGVAKFTGLIDDMRLRRVHGDGTVGPLDEKICYQLQAFVRLRKKLGWAVHDTAVVLQAITTDGLISPAALNNLAAIKRLALEADVSAVELLPLWGDIDVYEPGSLYSTLFLSPKLSPANEILQADKKGQYLPNPPAKLSDNIAVVLAALHLPAAAYDAISKATDMKDVLTIGNLSMLYRISMFCKLIDIPTEKYPQFLSLGYTQHFASPIETLETVKEFMVLIQGGWTLDTLLLVTRAKAPVDPSAPMFSIDELVSATVKIIGMNTTKSTEEEDGGADQPRPALNPTTLSQTVRSFFSSMPDEILQYMLSGLLTIGNGLPIVSALAQLKKPDLTGQSFKGYFSPPVTGTYSFTAVEQKSKPTLFISGVSIDFSQTDSNTYKSQQPRRLLSGQAYEISWTGNPITNLQWDIGTTKPIAFNEIDLVDKTSVSTTTDALAKILQVDQLVETCVLSVDEVHYYQQHVAGFDFNKLARQNVQDLMIYTDLRPIQPPDGTEPAILTLRKWLLNPDDVGTLTRRLASLGDWSEAHIRQVLDANYPTIKDADIISILRDIRALSKLHSAIVLTANLRVPTLPPTLLYALTEPARKPKDNVDTAFNNAKEFRAAAQSKRSSTVRAANDLLRDRRRQALVTYLLQQDYIRVTHKLTDADSLYEYFLIDVQMGSGFKTSRLKQAISVAQLYLQRCMLGLEEPYGVPKTVIKREEWDLMMRYRLWEANRKAFLYPENWIDPTLRDDKSEQFAAMETSISRKKLTNESIEEAMSSYINSLSDVAHLEVQTYLWERRDQDGEGFDRNQGCIHLFARTVTTPSSYYYRRVDIMGPLDSPVVFWKAWTKIDVGIVAQETDSEGRKLPTPGVYLVPVLFQNRLFLFIPHFTLKAVKKQTTNHSKTFSEMADDPADPESGPEEQSWELTMGWSEFRNGKWSPKRVAQGALNIAGASETDAAYKKLLNSTDKAWAEKFPDIKSFQFSTRIRTAKPIFGKEDVQILTIDVDRWLGKQELSPDDVTGYKAYPLGRFELRGQRLILNDPDLAFVGQSTIPTDFMRLSWRVPTRGAFPNICCDRYGGELRALLAVKSRCPQGVVYTWQLSIDSIHYASPTGFVVHLSASDESLSLLGYPPVIPDPPDDNYYKAFFTVNLHNDVSPILLESESLGGGLRSICDTLSNLPKNLYGDAFGNQHGAVFHEQANPYALYTWETAVHAISLLMERLKSSGQQELALNIGRLAFDPSWEDKELGRVWRFPPFRDADTVNSTPLDPAPTWENKLGIMEWNMNPGVIHAAARGHPVAYMKRLAIKYMEILIDAGDDLFRLNSIESIPLALQRYVEASHIFGPVPIHMPQLQKRQSLTYNQLASAKLDPLSNATVDLELDFPFQSDPSTRGQSTEVNAISLAYIETGYFCIPSNAQVMALKSLIDDRMYKIRNNLDIDGNVQDRPLFEPPIDPGQLVRARAAGISPSTFANDSKGPIPKHRFMYLLQRAFQLAEELKSMDSLILTIRERKDAETLLKLTTSHRQTVQQLVLEGKKAEIKEALKAIDVLQETRRMHEQRLSYYLALTGDQGQTIPGPETAWRDIPQLIDRPTSDDLRMSSTEKLDMDCTESAVARMPAVSILENVAADLLIFPQATINAQPLGVGVSTELGTGIAARAVQAAAGILRATIQHTQDQAMIAGKKAGLVRQLQERRQQANQAGREIKLVDQQVLVQKLFIERLEAEMQAQKQESENIAQELEWFQSKYTNEQLYTWLENQYGAVYQDTYTIASQLAQKVQKAYRFEQPRDDTAYLNPVAGGYWDSSRDGLLSGTRLSLDLKRIEMAYLNGQPYDYEVEKTISLRQLHPLGLLKLRATGTIQFNLPETLFDMDYPGHYCRRIVSVSLRIPCVVGPYVSLNCTLTLQSNTYRISSDGDDYGNPNKDGAFRTDVIPITSIAVSSSHHDSGRFDFDSYSEKYRPFEGAGAISTWNLELPKQLRQFDYQTISDVVMQVRYTSLGGGQNLGNAATASLLKALKDSTVGPENSLPSAIVDVKCDFASQWYVFTEKMRQHKATEGSLTMSGLGGYLPFWASGFGKASAYSVSLLIMPAIQPAQFDLQKNLILTGPSGGVSWKSSETMGDCIMLQSDNVTQDLKAVANWTIKLASAPPPSYVFENAVLVLGYTLA